MSMLIAVTCVKDKVATQLAWDIVTCILTDAGVDVRDGGMQLCAVVSRARQRVRRE